MVAVGFSALALAIRYLADPLLGAHQAFTAAFAAVAFASWHGTWRAGLLCAVLSFLWADYFFVEPRLHLMVMSPSKAVESAFYWALVTVILYISHRAIKSRDAAKHLIARLQAADAQKSELLATLAHEMRSPLSAIGSAIQILELGGAQPETRSRATATLARQAAYMNRLTEDLMDAARIQQGKIDLKLERAAIADLVAAALEAVDPVLRERKQRCEVFVAGEVPELVVDSARMYQVLTNLLFNASKYSPDASVIRIEAKLAHNDVCISVTDSGAGIPPSKLDWVFDTFSQVKQGGQGLGLGLSLVRRLVQLHGGSVNALSRGEGEGTRFEILLPVEAPSAPAPTTAIRTPDRTPG
ncbi:HAMP domain-containing sensor histidine kinase [Ramlibacter tataouinensis]|uniref:sensor histidine kinase n=1 Tax=Ramlibacter tataouinensis TaxID=94132 RepID=UPI0022F406C3|nr:HAMP domain-containing sensor histidine kinase [Ramlibacter tataouinensis]WBY01180.1 HAMP domain-containing sensor histidine kinase [Ramlibacter tataouinensis]